MNNRTQLQTYTPGRDARPLVVKLYADGVMCKVPPLQEVTPNMHELAQPRSSRRIERLI